MTAADRAPSLFPHSGEGARTTPGRAAEGSARPGTDPVAPDVRAGAAGQTRGPSASDTLTSVPPCAAEGPRTPPRVLGLDLSITATGVADITRHGRIITSTIRTDPKDFSRDERGTRLRLTHIVSIIAELIPDGDPPALVAVEGPSYGSKGNALHQLAGLWWLTYDHLVRAALPVVVIPPGQVKKYATGKGTADKTAMAVALQRHAGIELGDDNQVDAWWLRCMGLDYLGEAPVKLPAAQRAALDKITWPEVRP